jgi:hypothetical protein
MRRTTERTVVAAINSIRVKAVKEVGIGTSLKEQKGF